MLATRENIVTGMSTLYNTLQAALKLHTTNLSTVWSLNDDADRHAAFKYEPITT